MRGKKRDANHREIVKIFKEYGCSVFDTADVGNGFPDLVVGKGSHNLLVEVKTPKGILTSHQILFRDLWQGSYHIVKNRIDVHALLVNVGLEKDFEHEPDMFDRQHS